MEILVYYPRAEVGDGGPTLACWGWANAWAQAGNKVTILVAARPSAPYPIADRATVSGVHIRRIDVDAGLPNRRHFMQAVRDIRPTLAVLHSVFVPGNWAAARMLHTTGVSYLVMPHGGYHPAALSRRRLRKALAMRFFERRMLRRALGAHVFWPSEQQHISAASPRLPVISAPTGTEPSRVEWQGFSPDAPLLWFGRFDTETKGLDILAAAFGLYRRQGGTRRLLVRGRPDVDSQETIDALFSQHVDYRAYEVGGPVTSVVERDRLLAFAGAFVAPSRAESHSLAVVEALSVGVPCIVPGSTPIGPELASRNAALVVESNSSIHLAAALHRVDVPEVVRTAMAGRNFAEGQLAWRAVVKRWTDQIDPSIFAK